MKQPDLNQTKILVADFETTTNEKETEVWLAGFKDIDKKDIYQQDNIEDFMRALLGYVESQDNEHVTVFFHNLKFDGSFILNFFESRNLPYESFINDMGVWYSIKIEHYNYKITFRDSLKLLPMTIAQMAGVYNVEAKGETPLLKLKPKKIKPEWYKYHEGDLNILSAGIYDIAYNQKFKKFTDASEALTLFKSTLDKKFRDYFPKLSPELDKFFRAGYSGGWTKVNPKYANRVIETPIEIYDKNSMYPGVMLNYALPYGKPKKVKSIPKKGLWVANVDIKFTLKNKSLACIHATKEMVLELNCHWADYVESSNGMWFNITITNYDYELIKRAYNTEFIFHDIYVLKSKKGFFDKYINKFKKMKEEAPNLAIRTYAKLMLNSLYGKFGAKIISRQKYPYLEDGVLRFKTGDFEEVEPIYVPMAMFITSIARFEIVNNAIDNYDNFLYADTDSLHLIKSEEPVKLDIHPTHFGLWKLENKAVKGKYIRAKLYCESILNKDNSISLDVKGAGMTPEIKKKVTYDNFKIGSEFSGKKSTKQIRGGMCIYETNFKIRQHQGIYS